MIDYGETRSEWKAVFAQLDNEELLSVCGALSDFLIIPNWFNRRILEDVVGEPITPEAFQDFLEHVKKSDYDDEVSGRMRDIWNGRNDEAR